MKLFLQLSSVDSFNRGRIGVRSSLWICQEHAIGRAPVDRGRSKSQGLADFRTVLPELSLGADGVAVVKLCSAAKVDN